MPGGPITGAGAEQGRQKCSTATSERANASTSQHRKPGCAIYGVKSSELAMPEHSSEVSPEQLSHAASSKHKRPEQTADLYTLVCQLIIK